MRKIAIVTVKEQWNSYDDYCKVIESITEWSEVSEEDYELLVKFSYNHDWKVIERLDSDPTFIPRTVEAAIREAHLEAEKVEKQHQAADKKKQERLLKKRAKDEAAEKKLLEQLLAKHGELK